MTAVAHAEPTDLEPGDDEATADLVGLDVPSRTQIARAATGALSTYAGQTEWNEQQLAALAERGMPSQEFPGGGGRALPKGALDLLLHTSQVTGLDPLRGEIIVIETWDTLDDGSRIRRHAVIITYHAMVGLAQSTGQYEGMEGPEYLVDEATDTWRPYWTNKDKHPEIVRARVFRRGVPRENTPWAIVHWDEVCPTVQPVMEVDGRKVRDPNAAPVPHPRWQRSPVNMLGKCGKAAAHRATFADVLANMYLGEEMERAQIEAAEVEDEMQRARERRAMAERADVQALLDAGRGEPTVVVGAVVGDAPGKAARLAEDAAARVRAAREQAAERAAGPVSGWDEAPEDEQGSWLWEELEFAAEALGLDRAQLTGPLEVVNGPLAGWAPSDLLDLVGPMRRTVAQALREAGRTAEAAAYSQIGPRVVAPLDVLLGRAA